MHSARSTCIPPLALRASDWLWCARQLSALDRVCPSPCADMQRHRRATPLAAVGLNGRQHLPSARRCHFHSRLTQDVPPTASPRSACAHERPSEWRSLPSPGLRERAAVSRHPFTRRHRRGVPWPPFLRGHFKPATPLSQPGSPPLASPASRTLALCHWPPRHRHLQAAAARHWRSMRPTLPMTGIVGHAERPTVLGTT